MSHIICCQLWSLGCFVATCQSRAVRAIAIEGNGVLQVEGPGVLCSHQHLRVLHPTEVRIQRKRAHHLAPVEEPGVLRSRLPFKGSEGDCN
eukprot:1142442-Pelagomonas_calceolata.AAC.6